MLLSIFYETTERLGFQIRVTANIGWRSYRSRIMERVGDDLDIFLGPNIHAMAPFNWRLMPSTMDYNRLQLNFLSDWSSISLFILVVVGSFQTQSVQSSTASPIIFTFGSRLDAAFELDQVSPVIFEPLNLLINVTIGNVGREVRR